MKIEATFTKKFPGKVGLPGILPWVINFFNNQGEDIVRTVYISTYLAEELRLANLWGFIDHGVMGVKIVVLDIPYNYFIVDGYQAYGLKTLYLTWQVFPFRVLLAYRGVPGSKES